MGRYRFRDRREWLGLTQGRVAKLIGDRAAPSDVSRAERGNAPAWIVRRLRTALAKAECERLRFLREQRRIDRQRAVWVDVPDCEGARRLRQMMADQAWSLLEQNRCEEADRILEFLPEAEASQLLDDFFGEETAA